MSQNKIFIMDTTLRDGEQTQGVSFSPSEKRNVAIALLKDLKVDRIEVASAKVSAGELDAVKLITTWAKDHGHLDKVEVLGFVDHTKSVDWIKEAGGRVINLLCKGSEKHCHGQLKKTLAEHVEDIKKTVAYALEQNFKVHVYLEDWSNGYINSPDYVFEMVNALKDTGISRFMLPDTLGVMSPWEVEEAILTMQQKCPGVEYDFHPHNDYGLATANALFAAKAGVKAVHCTINCLGERAGNASLAEVAVTLKDKLGYEVGIDESKIQELSQLVEGCTKHRVHDNAPIVGNNVFTQTAGIHADGDHKGDLYKALDPARFGRSTTYALGKMSGKASIIKNLEYLGLGDMVKENQEKVLKRIVALGDQKEMITPDDLRFIVAEVLHNNSYNHVELVNLMSNSGLGLKSTVALTVMIKGEERKEAGSGNGGFDAFVNAMKKVLSDQPIEFPNLVDYEIRIPRGGHTSALTLCIITWEVGKQRFKTTGVSPNQVFAGVEATMKMINLQFEKLRQTGPAAGMP